MSSTDDLTTIVSDSDDHFSDEGDSEECSSPGPLLHVSDDQTESGDLSSESSDLEDASSCSLSLRSVNATSSLVKEYCI